ncbi:hypothetical protein L1987_08085 [Smallanthus sonchifolius]|uniref:Uncharacterized protein n=1 Tax=Smallanthus sonchifolius TaxID=185202 RepID=A0ACB9JJM6_9ASTR|nr:hypothetical protein L1987_08085 [Smallanthus sonchifolius]
MQSFQETPMNKDEESEESSWTFYFEEFLWQNDQKVIMNCNETLNSLAPDAISSSIIKKAACFQDDQTKKPMFKKRKNKGVIIDDSLEDTASSPLSCSKVTYFDQVKIKNKNKKTLHISEEKVGTCEEEINKIMVSSNIELKKRGLCLAPLSSFANYLS